VAFADVHRSTALGEQSATAAFAALLNRFYHAATETLIRYDSIIDRLIGDQVMALFIPDSAAANIGLGPAEASVALMKAMGYGQAAEPWLPLGAAVNSGVTYVGYVASVRWTSPRWGRGKHGIADAIGRNGRRDRTQ
jgi:adenylate cyclase